MKILHINTNDTGGAAIAAIRLHYMLLNNGVESKILFLQRSGKMQINEAYYFEDLFSYKLIFSFLLKLNTAYNRRFTFYKPKVYFNGISSLFNLTKHPIFAWADVIHLHWVIKFLDWKSVFKNTNKKYVWTCHDMNPFTGGNHYETGYHKEFKNISEYNIAQKAKIIKTKNVTLIGPSSWMAELIKKSEVFFTKPVFVLRNPVNQTVFNINKDSLYKKELGIEESKKIILFVAENPDDERKGFSLLLKALHKMENKDQYHLLIIGNKINVTCGISFTQTGVINSEALLCKIYNIADVFVIPSIEDNLPNTISEALLCGTAVVGFNIGGVPEMVQHKKNGIICDNIELLNEAITEALSLNIDSEKIRNLALLQLEKNKLLSEFINLYSGNN